MKKFFIAIAVLALVASAACTKVNPEEKKSDKISFTVANYMPQTKANSSLDSEGFGNFACDAWQFPEVGTTTRYMDSVVVNHQNPTATDNTNVWAPTNDYYWPKTGYINFYSHAGTKAPKVTASTDFKTVTMKYDNVTIEDDDNFMVADPALHFGLANWDANQVTIHHEQGDFIYGDDPETDAVEVGGNYKYTDYTGTDFKGVPTLFHHMLAKVAFVIKLSTVSAASTSTDWTVTILNGTTADSPKSNIEAFNKGSLTLTNTDNASVATVSNWSLPSTTDKIGWQAGTSTEVMDFEEVELVLEHGKTQTAIDTLLPVRTVMPQVTSGVDFKLVYKVSAKHTDETNPFMEETISVSKKLCGEETDNPATLAPTAWNMNQITLYTITIDPVGKKVTFDPAVVEWDAVNGDLIELPE